MENDLEFHSTDELIDELMKRCDCGTIALYFDDTEENSHDAKAFKGNPWMAIGLMEQLKGVILSDIEENSEDLGNKFEGN